MEDLLSSWSQICVRVGVGADIFKPESESELLAICQLRSPAARTMTPFWPAASQDDDVNDDIDVICLTDDARDVKSCHQSGPTGTEVYHYTVICSVIYISGGVSPRRLPPASRPSAVPVSEPAVPLRCLSQSQRLVVPLRCLSQSQPSLCGACLRASGQSSLCGARLRAICPSAVTVSGVQHHGPPAVRCCSTGGSLLD